VPTVDRLARGAGYGVFEYRCDLGPGSAAVAERHARHVLAVVRAGSVTVHQDGRAVLLERGSVMLGDPGREYACSHEHGGRDVCTVFEYEPEQLDAIGRGAGFGRASLPPDARLEGAIRGAGRGLGWDEAALVVLGLALAAAGGAPRAAGSLGRGVDRDRVHDAAAFLIARAPEPLSLADAARVAGLSPFHFLRVFRRELGVTPHRFLILERLRRAQALLRETRASVTEIALAVGFGDLSHFQHTFRAHVGVTPGRYRRGELPAVG
jgi:AraC-like DNA-binding protein